MDTQEIIASIAKLKTAIEKQSNPDVKAKFEAKLKQLESQLSESESKVEKQEQKAAAQEKKEVSKAEEDIKKLEAAIAKQTNPDIKAKFEKKLAELKGTLKDVKQEIKEEKKEIAEQKKEIKQAAKEVKSAQKEVRKTAIKKAAKKKVERKKVEVKKTKRKEKLQRVLSDLDAMIEKNKKLKSKYGSGYKGTGKPSDLERDAGRKAKPFGYRFVGKHDYRVPTEMQIKRGLKRGTIDYEARPNRADVNPDKKVKLANGGEIFKKYERNEDKNLHSENVVLLAKHYGTKEDLKNAQSILAEHERIGYMPKDLMEKRMELHDRLYDKMIADKNKMAHGGKLPEHYLNSQNGIKKGDIVKVVSKNHTASNDMFVFDRWNDDKKGFKGKKYSPADDYTSVRPMYITDAEIEIVPKSELNKLSKDRIQHKKYIEEWEKRGMMKRGGRTKAAIAADKRLKAKKAGRRISEDGNVYYESRANRSDVSRRDKLSHGGMAQGYNDREDERLGMEHGKISKKDFLGSHSKREHSRRDDAGFETRMKKGGKVGTSKEDRARYAKPAGWRWKDEAVTKRVIERKQLSMQPSKKMRDKYPDLVYYEDRLNKADKKPTRTSADSI